MRTHDWVKFRTIEHKGGEQLMFGGAIVLITPIILKKPAST